MTNKSKCVACFSTLHEGGKFPEDYPEEWKMCCGCLDVANVIVGYSFSQVIDFFRRSSKNFDRKAYIKRTERINKLINVN